MTTARPCRATAASIGELERHEVVGGELVQKASPSGWHGRTQFRLAVSLGPFYGRSSASSPGGWWFGTEVEIELERHEVYVPDLAGWRIERVATPPDGKPVRVVPDWVCEVLSPSTAGRDLGHKRRVYHQHGVSHLWIADPQNLALLVFRAGMNDFEVALSAGPGEVVRAEPFDAVELAVADIFGLVG